MKSTKILKSQQILAAMQNSFIYKIIPHRRYLPEDLIEDTFSNEINSSAEETHEQIQVFDSKSESELEDNSVYDLDGQIYKIKEFRDEANRPWWKFFDEFEYRETVSEEKKYKWYRWFIEGQSTAEKRLLFKLDILIAFYAFIGYWVKFIDSANLNNAYVSGMKEDLGLKGNDLIDVQVLFNVGQIIFQLPWLFFLPKVSITYTLFITELCWATFTLCTFRIENIESLKAIRFLVGAAEAAYFPCIHHLLANWYLPSEVSRRGAIFYIGQFLGVLTSGLLQGAAYKNLSGINGLAGWRWMFIVDGCISFGVAILALIFIPGTPLKCYSLFLTDEEIRLARKRMLDNGTDLGATNSKIFNLSAWKKAFSSWHVYLLSIANIMEFNTNNTSSGSFILWLKSLNQYSITEINNLSTIPPALGILYIIIVCGGADITRKRFLFIIFSFFMNFIGNMILAIWNVPNGAKWFAFCFGYWSWSQSSVLYPMINDFFRKDSEVKAIAWMTIYIMGIQSSAWISRLIWPTVDSPRYKVGFSTCAGFSIGLVICLSVAYLLYKRDERRDALKNGIYVYNSKVDPNPKSLLTDKIVVEKSIQF
jgi:MFS family permease